MLKKARLCLLNVKSALVKVQRGYRITIPKHMCTALGIKVGDFVRIQSVAGGIQIEPVKRPTKSAKVLRAQLKYAGLHDRDLAAHVANDWFPVDRDDVLTPVEAKLVRRGEAQLKRGESKPWRTVKDELAR